ncbi:THO complex subunit 2 isoform X2 [Hydra vulgaris]|uniref:THO complex subunit 2 n=1 Tax=Hydra vulgaris TaxID=6087 RepID=T2M8K4_HYDVU|nr:THO complex subunit 2 isoform X2 [Hydra vulgaris]
MATVMVPDKVLKNWNEIGRKDLLSLCSTPPKKMSSLISKKDLRKGFHQLIWLTISGQSIISDTISLLENAIGDSIELASLFADILAVADTETVCIEDKSCREQFLSLLSAVITVVPDGVLKERLDPETLESAGFIQSQKVFNQKLVRTKTKLFYKQQKYNLLREESEGYAKLITELSQDVSLSNQASMLENIKSLLGFFNLDPNRVLDILLEAFECQVDEDLFFIPLLTSYLSHCDISGFCHLIGFKFQYYHQSVDSITPQSLYKLAASLLRNNLLEMSDIYPHLHPTDSEIHSLSEKITAKAKEDAKKMNAIILSENVDSEDKSDKNDDDLILKDNQKFGLCQALLEIGAWNQALKIINQLPNSLLMSKCKIASSLCHLIHCTIEPLYRSKFSPKGAVGNVYRTKRGFPQPCLQYSQLCDYVFPMLFTIGVQLSIDPILVVKIIRVAKGFMKEYNQLTEALKEKQKCVMGGILTLIDEVLFPVISVLDCNCAVAEELWGLIKRLPYQLRYRLYALWKNQTYSVHPKLILAKAKIIKRAKYITKRLSKENVKPSGRQIGKLSHSNPGVLFDHLLDQIQRYDNFIGPMVDALKYLNPLAYDVLAFCIIEALANPDKQRMKQSDTNLSYWMQSLSQFCGAVFKKYPTEITGLLQYIANQLKDENSLDLLVLKEVVQKMSGVEANDEITPQQLDALSGGELMKSEGAYFSQIRNTRKPSLRLRDALMEGKLTIPLCILIAQQRNAVVYVEEQQRHLKLIGKLYDQCQDNLIQFGGFLTIQLSTHDYQASLPSLDEFHETYGLTPDVSFFLTRPVYKFEIQEKMEILKQSISQRNDLTSQKLKQQELEKSFCETCDNIFRPVVASALPLQTNKIWGNLSPLLYVTFWSMTMYDLNAPKSRYDDEISKLETAITEVDASKEITSSSKRRKEKERCQLLIDKLKEEFQTQLEHNKLIRIWLESKKDAWFPSKMTKGEMITQFLQLCIFPRCVFSAIDALYCAKFIQTIHTLQAPNFSTLICFDRTFSDVSYIVASLTENEASRYGRFLCAMLEMVSRWHQNKQLYEEECANVPGFLTVLRLTNNEKASYLDYENFRHVCYKWQYKLTKALILGIESQDFTQIRNTLLVLIKILPYYPQVQNLGQALERRIEKVIEEEKENRQDLQALAIGYKGMLKTKKEKMVPENKFHAENEKNSVNKNKPAVKANLKQDVSDDRTSKVKREELPKLSATEKRTSSRTDTTSDSTGKSEREKIVIEENSYERKKASSHSPHNNSSSTEKVVEVSNSKENGERSKESDRIKEKDDWSKEKRSRTDSPTSDDLKKRKRISDDSHNASIKRDKSNEKRNDNKRQSSEPDLSDSKKRKDETSVSESSDQRIKKTEGLKRDKSKKDYEKDDSKQLRKEPRPLDSKRSTKSDQRSTQHKDHKKSRDREK